MIRDGVGKKQRGRRGVIRDLKGGVEGRVLSRGGNGGIDKRKRLKALVLVLNGL